MFELQRISLVHFKNYINKSFHFNNRVVGIHGANGVGKTNLLDAIHYLCFTKSYFARSDQVNVNKGRSGFRIEGDLERLAQKEKAVCILRENGRKEFSINNEPYSRFADHIGRYPCVIIAPDDIQMITGSSEERRRFLDALLSQLDPVYLDHLIQYNKILLQRNSYLKNLQGSSPDLQLIDALDRQLIHSGKFIFETRRDFLFSFINLVRKQYTEIAGNSENVTLLYQSDLLENEFEVLLKNNLEKDRIVQRTTAGVHRDDLIMQMDNAAFKNFASQGQRKSLLFALKLAELHILSDHKKYPPLLLLDDVFEKLDEKRTEKLLALVRGESSQVFVTDTHESRLREFLADAELIGL